jgi:hypothetical protein
MNYTIVGTDGKTYGPVSADQVRQWIRQARVDSRTAVFVTGAADWTFAGLLPEFAAEFPGSQPGTPPPQPGPIAAPTMPPRKNQLATWGFICALLSWTCCGCCLPLGILGLTFSIIALVQVNASTTPMEGRGLAIAGLVLSALNLLWSFGITLAGMLNDSSQIQLPFGN